MSVGSTVRVISTANGKQVQAWTHKHFVTQLIAPRSGRWVAVRETDGAVTLVVGLDTNELQRFLIRPGIPNYSSNNYSPPSAYGWLAIGLRGNVLLEGTRKGLRAHVIDGYNYRLLDSFETFDFAAEDIGRRYRVLFKNSGGYHIWDSAETREVKLETPPESANSAVVSPDENLVAVAGNEGGAVYEITTGQLVLPLSKKKPIDKIAFSADSRHLAVAYHGERGLRFIDIIDLKGPKVRSIRRTFEAVDDLVFGGSNSKQLAIVHKNHSIVIWDLDLNRSIPTIGDENAFELSAFYISDQRHWLIAMIDSSTNQLVMRRWIPTPTFHDADVEIIQTDPNERWLLSVDSSGKANIWHSNNNSPSKELDFRPYSWDNGRPLVAVGKDSNLLALGLIDLTDRPSKISDAGMVTEGMRWGSDAIVFDSVTGKELIRLPHSRQLASLIFLTGRHLIATGTIDTVIIWNLSTGREFARLQHEGAVRLAASPNGQWLAGRRRSIES